MFEANPGNAMCMYYGYGNEICNTTTIKASKMPGECTSFLISMFLIDRYNQTNTTTEENVYILGIYSGE